MKIPSFLYQGVFEETRPLGKIRMYIEEAYKKYRTHSLHLLPAHIAFFILWSVVPLMLLWDFVQRFFSHIDFDVEHISMVFVEEFVDTDQMSQNMTLSWQGIVFFCLVIYFSSRAFYSIIHASNYIYGLQKDKNFIKVRAKGVLLSVFFILSFFITMLLTVFGQGIINMIEELIGSRQFLTAIKAVRWPAAFLMMVFVVFGIYNIAPSKKLYWKVSIPGTLFTVVLWSAVSWGYSIYLQYFANYTRVYSSFSNIIILMIWIYMLSYVLVLGLLINAVVLERYVDPSGDTSVNKEVLEEYRMGPPS